MILLYITNGISGGGGLERVLSIKASYFAEEFGYDVHIITLNDAEETFYPFSSSITIHPIEVSKDWKYLFSYIQKINRIVKKVQPDIISVCDDGLKGLYVPLWIKKGKAKIIYERHASMILNGASWQKFWMRMGGHLYDKIVVLTNYNLSEWSSTNLTVIPNPVSFYPQESSSLENHQIVCVGSLSYNKGYDLLIDAWSKIASQHPTWSVHIYGKGDASIYQTTINQLGLQKQITFHPPVQNIESIYQQASLLVLPSRSEGFGMVLIEAMAYGVPCVAFDCPCGPRDIVQNGKNGYLVKAQDTEILAKKIEILIEDKESRIKMGKFAKQTAQQYLINRIALQWKDLFES